MKYISSIKVKENIRKWFLIAVCFILPATLKQLKAQQASFTPVPLLTRQITLAKQDSDKAKLLFQLGKYYFDKPGAYKSDLDSGQLFIKKALNLSSTFPSLKLRNQFLLTEGICYSQNDALDKAKQCFTTLINYHHKIGDKTGEADAWDQYGESLPRDPAHIDTKIRCYYQAFVIYKSILNQLFAISELKKVADMHIVQGKFAQAESELLTVVAGFKAIHYNKLHYTYDLLAGENEAKGDLQMSLFYRLQAVKSMEASGDSVYSRYFYDNLASAYNDVGMAEKSLKVYKTVLKLAKADNDYNSFYDGLRKTIKIYADLNEPQQALSFLKKQSSETPPVNDKQKEWLNAGYGICYEKLGDEKKAEQYYLEMVRYAHLDNKSDDLAEYMQSDIIISRFYVKFSLYKKATPYLDELLKLPRFFMKAVMLNEIELNHFKVDSAARNYLVAINHYQAYKRINDSLFSVNQKKMLDLVQLKNQSDNKDIALQLQSKNILLLTKQGQLEHNQVERSQIMRNILIGGTVMLLLLLALGYNRYRLKQQSNVELQRNQKIISRKNEELEKSLHENEWLLREVHHRVKNNMQMVSSLLVSQCEFLKDEAAVNAMMESRHRVQAMSLIHQKLYKTKNVSTIYMPEYVGEMVDYLKASFKTRKTIYFAVTIAPIHLDVQQALPVALILNEVITNAINHAFPHTENEKIEIDLSLTSPEDLVLRIADNGKGLPAGFTIDDYKDSFGLLLIKGMTEDIGGSFTIDGTNGTIIHINFKLHPES